MERRTQRKKRSNSHSHRMPQNLMPDLREFFFSVSERMKSLAIAQKYYRARNDKELSVQPGDFFEVLDDEGSWWCLRTPTGRTGHVPSTHLEIIENPVKEADQLINQPVDPIVVKVPIIVKASVQHEEVEEEGKLGPQTVPATTPPPATPPLSLSKRSESLASATIKPKATPVPPPQQIFPPLKPINSAWPYYTVVKEIIREVSPHYHNHRRRAKTRHLGRRDASPVYSSSTWSQRTNSSSGVESWISDGEYEKVHHRQRISSRNRRPIRQPHRSFHRASAQPSKLMESGLSSHHPRHSCHDYSADLTCRHRSVCCYSPVRSTMAEKSRRAHKEEQSQPVQQQQQPQQPMIILLEQPKQEAAAVMEQQSPVDDYYDSYNQPQISVVLPYSSQIAPQLSAYSPLQPSSQPQFTHAPTYYNWSPQYYQGYV